MHATLELARRIDRAEIDFCAMATLGIAPDAATLERGGGLAVYSAPGSPVNKVLGLGLGVECSDDDLDAIEDFYAERGCPVQIELCPLTSPDLPSRLSKRGFVLQAFENELARLAPTEPVPSPSDADITVEVGAGEHPWLEVVAEGFSVPDRIAPGSPPVPLRRGRGHRRCDATFRAPRDCAIRGTRQRTPGLGGRQFREGWCDVHRRDGNAPGVSPARPAAGHRRARDERWAGQGRFVHRDH